MIRRRFFAAPARSFSPRFFPALVLALCCSQVFLSCVSSAARAEEFYALGMAYFELRKYDEAAAWLEKAKFHRATRAASEYNLGRVAYERGRYGEAARYFEALVEEDGENLTALRDAAYTYIKLEEPEKAALHYRKILDLVPDSSDDGYNHALVLLALGRAAEAEEILVKYNNTENPRALLLLARAQRKEGKPEAADAYSASLLKENNPVVRAEYAACLAEAGLSARALDEYRRALEGAAEADREAIRAAIAALEADVKGGSK